MTDDVEQRVPAHADECTELPLSTISISENSILRIHGYRDFRRVRPAIRNTAVSAARETETLITPQVYFRILNVQSCKGKVLKLQCNASFENEAFERFLKGARQVAVFILTMGPALDQAVIDYVAKDDLLKALFLETAGWLGIEAATKELATHLRAEASQRDCRLSPRLGPGYSYNFDGRSVLWSLEQQLALFALFERDGITVELLESCAMTPKISRSGLFGFLARP